MIKHRRTVAIALSGGLDSSCAASLLQDDGWNIVGIHLLIPIPTEEKKGKIQRVKSLSEQLNIPLYFLDVQELFQKKVIDYLINSYISGLTPNPCVVCNYSIKFGAIIGWMDQKGIDYLATGHYAKLKKSTDTKTIELCRAEDNSKDQTYFLHRLNQSHLKRSLFPLGTTTKSDIPILLKEKGLITSVQPESQEICFISDNDYRSFLRTHSNKDMPGPGNIVDIKGNIVGTHSGGYSYTIGQRHGLGIASAQPLYVYQIDPEKNEVKVANREILFSKILTAEDFTWIKTQPGEKRLRVKAQIRYRHEPANGTLTILSPGSVQFEFDTPQWAITPGQALVCYKGESVLGGGWIKKQI